MTILNNGTRNQYTATGGQTVFTYDFEIFDQGDIVVYRNATLLAISTDYTVSGAGNENGGTITLTSGATAGDVFTLFRDTTPERLSDYQNSGTFTAEEINSDLDRLWAVIQEQETNQSRFLQTSEITQVPLPVTLEDSVTNQYLRWKDPNTIESVPISAFPASGVVLTDFSQSVANYSALINLDPDELTDGQAIVITGSGIAGPGNIRKVVGHGFTSTEGIIVRIDNNTYWERQYNGSVDPGWFSNFAVAEAYASANNLVLEVGGDMVAVIRNAIGSDFLITNITQANPAVVTAVGSNFTNGRTVKISVVSGMTELNGNHYTVANATADTFELAGVDSTAFGAYVSGGTVNEYEGWSTLDDVGHRPNGFGSITTDSTTIRLNYNVTSSKVGSLLVTTDETFAQKGLNVGASVNLDHCLINVYQDLVGTIENATLTLQSPEFFGDLPTAVDNGDGSITVTHNSTGKQEAPIIALGSPGGAIPRLEGGIPKIISWNTTSFTYALFDKLTGFVEYNGSTWVCTTSSFTKPTITAFSSYLDLDFSGITFNVAQVVSQGGVYLNDVFGLATNKLRVSFKDYTGANVAPTSPNTNMKFYFSCEAFVRQEITSGNVNFLRKGVILNPQKFASNSGNFWVSGNMIF